MKTFAMKYTKPSKDPLALFNMGADLNQYLIKNTNIQTILSGLETEDGKSTVIGQGPGKRLIKISYYLMSELENAVHLIEVHDLHKEDILEKELTNLYIKFGFSKADTLEFKCPPLPGIAG
jgi:hypothetical protein